MAKENPLKTGKMNLLGIIVTGFIIGLLLIAAAYVFVGGTSGNNYPDYSLNIGIGRVDNAHIYVETPVGKQASKLLDSAAPGWGCFNVTANGSEVSNYVDASGSICSSKAGSRQYFAVPCNSSVVVVGNLKDNTSRVVWNGII
ncbi:MAG: hypothetical protein WBZ29_08710 [Methanocella sp.]